MRTFVRAVLLFVCLGAIPLHAQDEQTVYRATPLAPDGSYGIHGSDLLRKQEAELSKYLAQHPEAKQASLTKQAAWGFTVGSTKSWYATDLTSNTEYLVPSTCRAVGTNCYIFVEDGIWGTRANQAVVDSVRNAFDLRTPGNPNKGIYDTDVEAFGNPPNVDNDPKIIILILDIKDGFAGTGGYVMGYFYSLNEVNRTGSNKAEIYYLDANPLNLTTASGLQGGLSTMAHEFQHMIHWNYDSQEIAFVNEGCSLVAEVNAGYPLYAQSGFANETNHYLLDWRTGDNTMVLNDYSRAARFMTYCRDQFGMPFFKKLVGTNLTSVGGVGYAMSASGVSWTFADLVQNFAIANILNDRTTDAKYGYLYPTITKANGSVYYSPVYATGAEPEEVAGYGAMYMAFRGGTDLKATFKTDPNLSVTAVEVGPSSKRVVDVTNNVQFSEPGFGSTYNDVFFVITNRDGTPHTFTTSITGKSQVTSIELKYEVREPSGFLQLSPNDTVCVVFDGTPGAKLDSVRVALRRNGTITGGVWSYSGLRRPLGTPLAVPVTTTSTTNAPVSSGNPYAPYPIPYPNWGTIDLRSKNIDASYPFAVAFNLVGNTSTDQRVVTSKYPSTSSYHSFTYLTNPGSGVPDWYYVSADTGVYVYHIHAYVSIGGATGVKQTVELVPSTTALGQNYPNPFNPSTTLKFTLASREHVSLKLYDVLGKEVATIVNEELPAGSYTRTWNAAGFPSGVYFSTMKAGSVTETKRLVLTK